MPEPLLSVDKVNVEFPIFRAGSKHVPRAVDAVSFSLARQEILGVIGESGSGKSTLAGAITGLVPAVSGHIQFEGLSLLDLSPKAWRASRRHIQLVFQDPNAALNPRLTVGDAIAEGLRYLRPELDPASHQSRVGQALERVGLTPSVAMGYPHEFSGGQRQRVSIARAIVVEPKMMICDESVSALDVLVQAQVLDLLSDLRRDLGMSIMFISHDMAVIRQICDCTLVMYRGQVVEAGRTKDIIERPVHPYTTKLMQSVPRLRSPPAQPP
ncbi:MAG: ATP-binding cassette domain-containing protein [Pseudomonadota bacterium]